MQLQITDDDFSHFKTFKYCQVSVFRLSSSVRFLKSDKAQNGVNCDADYFRLITKDTPLWVDYMSFSNYF